MTNSNFAHFMPDENEETNQYFKNDHRQQHISANGDQIKMYDTVFMPVFLLILCLLLKNIFPQHHQLIDSSPIIAKKNTRLEKVKCTCST